LSDVQELYGRLWADDDSALDAELRRSLDPRSTASLYDAFAELGIASSDLVLDVGCRDANHAVELVRRHGCRVLALDPVPLHVERARTRVDEAGLSDRIEVMQGAVEAIPAADGTADRIWCRDVLNHSDVHTGLRECVRVLRPGGRMLVYQTFATKELEPREAERLFDATASIPTSMTPETFEQAAGAAGFEILSVDHVDSEWREHMIEQRTWDAADDLLAIARLRRREEELVERYGRPAYQAVLGGALWGIYQLLGKLRPTIYALERRDG
jgi:SAM-dependent methyltransferase